MAGRFNLLSKLYFLQDIVSWFIAKLDVSVVHNIEKYQAIKKSFFFSMSEGGGGSYLEFGVYTGSSFCHAMRCHHAQAFFAPDTPMDFYGFDSFDGFGEIQEQDKHPFYTDINFKTDYQQVKKRAERASKGLSWQLIPGFFEESLQPGAKHFGIKKASIIFIDSDTYGSASAALDFCRPITAVGTVIILDDYFAYKGSKDHGVCRAFNEYLTQGGFKARHALHYGNGGAVYVISSVNEDNKAP
ncbi:class I SAM-dependent methyltransferase [Magnetococcus sp. PR-3]|uniref:class I SAM-dependent methyltransferase n=1 Tax=Magnetococcus sp. PR-3 TaxID=3120355 RepID=UPI002FCE280B